MPHGITHGVKHGIVHTIKHNTLVLGTSMAGVAKDVSSGRFMPATAGQWTTTLAAAGIASGNPASLYLLQEPSGNPADSIGAFPLTAGGTLSYQQAVPGWTAKGITTAGGTSGTLKTVSASLPNIGTTSCMILAYVLLPTFESALRTVCQLGDTFNAEISAEINSNPKTMICQCDPNTATGASDNTAQVRPIIVMIDRTHGVAALSTDVDNLTPTLTPTPTGKQFLLGGDNTMSNFPGNCTYVYAARFDGGAAEMTISQRRALLMTLGWSTSW